MSGKGPVYKGALAAVPEDRESQFRQIRFAVARCGISLWKPTHEEDGCLFPKGNERIFGSGSVNGREVRHAIEWYSDHRVLCLSTAFVCYRVPVSMFRYSWRSIFCVEMAGAFHDGIVGGVAMDNRAYVWLHPEGLTFVTWLSVKICPSLSIPAGVRERFDTDVKPFLEGIDHCALLFAHYGEFPSDEGIRFLFRRRLGNA